MNPHELSRVDDSDLYFAVALILGGFEKYAFAFFALGIAVFCISNKRCALKILEKKVKNENRSR